MSKLSNVILCVLVILTTASLHSQEMDEVQFSSIKITDNIYMLKGAGGNIGLFFGPDGLFLIDDQFAPLHQKLVDKITELSGGTITDFDDAFLLNTHFHNDHTNGNELIGEAGGVIYAHENVRKRRSGESYVPFFDSRNPALEPIGLPVVTFSRDITFHLNGDSLSVFHVEGAHTDGDAVVHFTKANVIHAGDVLFTGTYPFFDIDNGGSVAGLIRATERLLAMCDEETVVIPGHGEISNRAELKDYHLMLTTTYKHISKLHAEGLTLEQVQRAKPTAEFDERFAGFISAEAFVGLLYRDVSEKGK